MKRFDKKHITIPIGRIKIHEKVLSCNKIILFHVFLLLIWINTEKI